MSQLDTNTCTQLRSALNDIASGKLSTFECHDTTLREILTDFTKKLEKQFYETADSTVSLSMGMNEAVISGAELRRASKEISESMNSISSATEELNASVGTIASSTEDVAGETSNMNAIAQENLSLSSEAAREIQSVALSVEESATHLQSLKDASAEITNVVGFISDVAKQTNLLALNATIEAARAGDAGKGFAVVANEVKQLANQTSGNTQKIFDSITNLNKEIEDISNTIERVIHATETSTQSIHATNQGMENILAVSSTIHEKTEAIKTTLSEQKEASNEITKLVSDVSVSTNANIQQVDKTLDAMDNAEIVINAQLANSASKEIQNIAVLLAKSDHIIWKKRLANMVVGRESLNPNELADHHSCRLGKWYDAVTDESIKNDNAYKTLLEPHQKVHKHGISAAEKYKNHDLQGALIEISEVEKASVDVIRLLDELLNKLN